MIAKKEIKYLISLKQKKFRIINNEFVIEGAKLILEALMHNQPIKQIIYSTKIEQFDEIRIKAKNNNIKLSLCTIKDAERISDTKNSQQIFALLKYPVLKNINTISANIEKPLIILDGISDPGNMGTILRTCSWFGCYNIVLTNNSVELYNPKTVRAGMGAHFHMENTYKGSVNDIIQYLKNYDYEVLTADLKGKNIEQVKLKNKNWSLILGNESQGISNDFKNISQQIHIPGKGKMESLNVAEAASIVIHYLSKK